MFSLDKGSSKLDIKFINYVGEEKRKNPEFATWAGFYVKVTTPIVAFESSIVDVMSAEIDDLKQLLKDFLFNNMKEITYYEPIEEPFNVVFYPKGRKTTYDNKGKIINLKELELSIRIPDSNYLSDISVKYVLNVKESSELLNYLDNLINEDYNYKYDEEN